MDNANKMIQDAVGMVRPNNFMIEEEMIRAMEKDKAIEELAEAFDNEVCSYLEGHDAGELTKYSIISKAIANGSLDKPLEAVGLVRKKIDTPPTFMGMPIQIDDSLPPGTMELRTAKSRIRFSIGDDFLRAEPTPTPSKETQYQADCRHIARGGGIGQCNLTGKDLCPDNCKDYESSPNEYEIEDGLAVPKNDMPEKETPFDFEKLGKEVEAFAKLDKKKETCPECGEERKYPVYRGKQDLQRQRSKGMSEWYKEGYVEEEEEENEPDVMQLYDTRTHKVVPVNTRICARSRNNCPDQLPCMLEFKVVPKDMPEVSRGDLEHIVNGDYSEHEHPGLKVRLQKALEQDNG